MTKTSLRKRFVPLGSWSPDQPEFTPGFLDQIANVIPVYGIHRTLQRLKTLSECDENRRVTGTYVHRLSVDQALDIMQPSYSEISPPFDPKEGFQAEPPSKSDGTPYEFYEHLRGLSADGATKVLLVPYGAEKILFGLFKQPQRVWDAVNPLIARFQYRIAAGFIGAYSFTIEIGRISDIMDPGNPANFVLVTGGTWTKSGFLQTDGVGSPTAVQTISIPNANFTDPGNEFWYAWRIKQDIEADIAGIERNWTPSTVAGAYALDAQTGLVTNWKNEAGSNDPLLMFPSIDGIVAGAWGYDPDTYIRSRPVYSTEGVGVGVFFKFDFPPSMGLLVRHKIMLAYSMHSTSQKLSLGVYEIPGDHPGVDPAPLGPTVQSFINIGAAADDTVTELTIDTFNPQLLASIQNWENVWFLLFAHVPQTSIVTSIESFRPNGGYAESAVWPLTGAASAVAALSDISDASYIEQSVGGSGPAEQQFLVESRMFEMSGAGPKVLVAGVDYFLSPGATTSNSFVRLLNASHTAMGVTNGTDATNQGAHQAFIGNPGNLLASLDIYRGVQGAGGATNIRFTIEIVQYLGGSGGDDEFIVRQVGAVGPAPSGTFLGTYDGADITTIADSAKVAVFVTSQAVQDTSDDEEPKGMFSSELVASGGNWAARLTRTIYGGSTYAQSSWAVVEFVGSNWRAVQRIQISPHSVDWPPVNAWNPGATVNNSDTKSLTSLGGVPLLDRTKSFMEIQYRHAQNAPGNNPYVHHGYTFEIAGEDLLKRRKSVNTTTSPWLDHSVIWIIESTSSTMAVQRGALYVAASAETGAFALNNAVISAVAEIDNTSLWGLATSTDRNTSNASSPGQSDFFLGSRIAVGVREVLKNHNRWHTFEVVEWPLGSGTILPNDPDPYFEVNIEPHMGSRVSAAGMRLFYRARNQTGTTNVNLTIKDLTSGVKWSISDKGPYPPLVVETVVEGPGIVEHWYALPDAQFQTLTDLEHLQYRFDVLSGSTGKLEVYDVWVEIDTGLASWVSLHGAAYFAPEGNEVASAPIDVSWIRLDGPAALSDIVGDELRAYVGTVEEPTSATQVGKIYEITSPDFATWNDVSKAGGYFSNKRDKSWSFTNYGSMVIATNYANDVQVKMEGTALFRNLIGFDASGVAIPNYVADGGQYPRARFAASINAFFCLANCDPTSAAGIAAPYSLWCSRYAQPQYFHGGLIEWQSSVFQLAATPGEITGMIGGEYGIVFKENSIWRVDYVGLPEIFSFTQVSGMQGTVQPRSLVRVENDIYFFGGGGIFVVRDGQTLHELAAQSSVRKFLFDSQFEDFSVSTNSSGLESEASSRIIGGYDAHTSCVIWSYMSRAADADYFKCDTALVYSPREDRFTLLRGAAASSYGGGSRIVSVTDLFTDNDLKVSGFLSLGNRANASDVFLMKTILVLNEIPPRVSSFSGEPVYPQVYRSDTIAASSFGAPIGVEIEIQRVRPILAVERAATAPEHEVWIEANQSPAVGDGTGRVVQLQSSRANADGWIDIGVPLSGEFFKFGLVFSEYSQPIVKEVHGWQVFYRISGDH